MLEFEFVLFTSCTLSLQNQTLCLNSLKFLIFIIFLIEVHDSEEKCLYIYVCVCVRMCVCVCAHVCVWILKQVSKCCFLFWCSLWCSYDVLAMLDCLIDNLLCVFSCWICSSRQSDLPIGSVLHSTELGPENGGKSKKKRKDRSKGVKHLEVDSVNHKNDLKEDKAPQNENKADNMDQNLPERKENQRPNSYK